MDVIKQSEISAAVSISETEAQLLSLAVDYWKVAMESDSPLVANLSERLKEITSDFDATLAGK